MEFRIEKTDLEDISDVIRIIMEVRDLIPDDQKEWFAVDDEVYTREVLTDGRGRGYKAVECESGKIAGVFTAIIPGTEEFNLGRDIGLSEEELLSVVHMDTAAVLPVYRGYGLQGRLMKYVEEDLKESGYHILCCTAHPDNRFSVNNILRQGYEIMLTKEKYGGLLRHIFMKRL